MWGLGFYDTMSGGLEADFPVGAITGGSWSADSASGGSVSVSLNMKDESMRLLGQASAHALTAPTGAHTLGLKCDGDLVWAWPLVRSTYDHDSGVLNLQGKELPAVFFRGRLTAPVSSITSGSLTITDKSHAAAVRAIINRATGWGATWALPIDTPSDASGGFSAHWDWWESNTINDLLEQIRKEGYDIVFEPYEASGGIRWFTYVSSALVTSDVHLNADSAETPIIGLEYDRDGSDLITGVSSLGNGRGSGTLARHQGFALSDRPIRDVSVSDTNITDLLRLQEIANAYYDSHKDPAVTFSVSGIAAVDPLHPRQFMPGTRLTIGVHGSPVIPDGEHQMKVHAVSGDFASRTVKPEVVPYGS